MHDERLADQRMRIADSPERIAAFERGLREGGYEGAQGAVADVLAARYEKGRYNSRPPLPDHRWMVRCCPGSGMWSLMRTNRSERRGFEANLEFPGPPAAFRHDSCRG